MLEEQFNAIYTKAETEGELASTTLINQLLEAAFEFCDGKDDNIFEETKIYVDCFFRSNHLQYHYGEPSSFEAHMRFFHRRKHTLSGQLESRFNSIFAKAEAEGYLGSSTLVNQLIESAYQLCDSKNNDTFEEIKEYVDGFFESNRLQYPFGSPASFEASVHALKR